MKKLLLSVLTNVTICCGAGKFPCILPPLISTFTPGMSPQEKIDAIDKRFTEYTWLKTELTIKKYMETPLSDLEHASEETRRNIVTKFKDFQRFGIIDYASDPLSLFYFFEREINCDELHDKRELYVSSSKHPIAIYALIAYGPAGAQAIFDHYQTNTRNTDYVSRTHQNWRYRDKRLCAQSLLDQDNCESRQRLVDELEEIVRKNAPRSKVIIKRDTQPEADEDRPTTADDIVNDEDLLS